MSPLHVPPWCTRLEGWGSHACDCMPLLSSLYRCTPAPHASPRPPLPAAAQDRVVRPDPQRHAEYRRHYEAYKRLYPALKPGFHAAAGGAAEPTAPPAAAPAAAVSGHKGEPLHSIVSPSILSADFAHLARDVQRVVDAGAELVVDGGRVGCQALARSFALQLAVISIPPLPPSLPPPARSPPC